MNKRSEDVRLVSVLTNAIGISIYGADGRTVSIDPETGAKSIEITNHETALCREAAFRALDHLDAYEKENGR